MKVFGFLKRSTPPGRVLPIQQFEAPIPKVSKPLTEEQKSSLSTQPFPTLVEEHSWTTRLAHVEQRTPIEKEAAALMYSIEMLGGHPLLTAAQNHVDRALRTLGAWTDAGEPGSVT